MFAFQVSRSVVREALSHLNAKGEVETRHGVGSFVSNAVGVVEKARGLVRYSVADVLEVFEVRMGFEPDCAGLAAQRAHESDMNRIEVAFLLSQQRATEQLPCVEANFRFHEAIAYATRNHRFVGILEQVHRQSDAAEQWGECGVRLGLQQALHERTNIFAAIKSRDADCARAAMRIHLINGSERCRQWRGADFEKRRLVSTP